MPAHAGPIRDLIDESYDEAAFLYRRWDQELSSLTRNLDDVWSWTEDRFHGALDGVRVAGEGLVGIAVAFLSSEELDRVVIAAGLLGSIADRPAVDALIEALAEAEGDRLRAIVRGLELWGTNDGLRAAAAALAARGPVGAAELCRLKSFRRAAMKDEIKSAFSSGIPERQIDAVQSVRHAPPDEFAEVLAAGLRAADPRVRAASAAVGACRRHPDAWATAVTVCRSRDESAASLLSVVAQLGSGDEHELIYTALRTPALQRPAISALGHIGTPRAVDLCLAGMRHESVARACGEAYCWITGANLVRDKLARTEEVPDAPVFEQDDLDANLVPTADAQWPLPDADAVQDHWRERSSDFTVDVRHIHGKPVTGDWLLRMVETGPMIRRPDLVFELQTKTRGRYDVETRAFAARQRHMMAAGRAAAEAGGR